MFEQSSHADLWDPFGQFTALQGELNRVLDSVRGARGRWSGPALEVFTDDDAALVTAELPGIDPAQLEVTVLGNTLHLTWRRPEAKAIEGAVYHRQERARGSASRTLELPFKLDPDKVTARYQHGVLEISAARAQEDKPTRVRVSAD